MIGFLFRFLFKRFGRMLLAYALLRLFGFGKRRA
jgi:hypothetical protein